MLTKGKLLILGIIVINLFGFLTLTSGICLALSLFILCMYILFKYSTRNNPYKKKVSVAQDFLKHKYGEKMGDYILKEVMNKKKNMMISIFSILCMFILFFNFMAIPVSSGLGDYGYGFEDSTTTGQVLLSESGFFHTYTVESECYVDTDHPKTGSKCYQMDAINTHDKYAYFNFTGMNITVGDNTSFWVYFPDDDTTGVVEIASFEFYNSDNVKIIDYYIKAQGSWADGYKLWYSDHDSDFKLKEFVNGNIFPQIGFVFNSKDSVTYWCTGASSTSTPKTVSDNYNITYMKIKCDNSWAGFGFGAKYWIDDFSVVKGTPYDAGDEYDLYFKIYDRVTSDLLNVYGRSASGTKTTPFIRTAITSDLWIGDYDNSKSFGTTVTLENLDIPTSGEWHYFNFTYTVGSLDGIATKVYLNSTNYLYVYPAQTYTIYISDVLEKTSGYNHCKLWYTGGLPCELCCDKEFYVQGESVNFRYKAPTEKSLYDIWWLPSSHYYLWIYDIDNLGWLFGRTDGGKSADNRNYIDNYIISLDNTYHYLQWNYDATEVAGYKTVTGGRDTYKAYIGHGGGGLFGIDVLLAGRLEFYVTSGIFTPHGNITSVSPSSPELGQKTQITFEVNNNGYMLVRNLLAPDESEISITTFAKFDGLSSVNYTFWDYGEYQLNLYVSSGIEYTCVDTETVTVDTLNDTYGGFGYNVEFLTTQPPRVVAGFDTLFINYRSLSSDGYILVNDSRGQQTPFSTFIGIKTGLLSIPLPNYAEIGEWNVTLFGNSTLYSNFHVVAEENNWVEFDKNIFHPDEIFTIELKHDRKIEVVFYKDNVAYGRDWFLESGIMSSGIYDVPVDVALPEIGDWRVEIWQVNNFIKIQKLAQDSCKVIQRTVVHEDIVVDDDIAGYLSNIDEFYKGLIGIFIVLLCTFMPFIAIRKLGESGVKFDVQIPPMLYTVCSGIGSIVALILGVWRIEYTFFICVMAGFATFALYLMGKRGD